MKKFEDFKIESIALNEVYGGDCHHTCFAELCDIHDDYNNNGITDPGEVVYIVEC